MRQFVFSIEKKLAKICIGKVEIYTELLFKRITQISMKVRPNIQELSIWNCR